MNKLPAPPKANRVRKSNLALVAAIDAMRDALGKETFDETINTMAIEAGYQAARAILPRNFPMWDLRNIVATAFDHVSANKDETGEEFIDQPPMTNGGHRHILFAGWYRGHRNEDKV